MAAWLGRDSDTDLQLTQPLKATNKSFGGQGINLESSSLYGGRVSQIRISPEV
jgi:hypothetical protein